MPNTPTDPLAIAGSLMDLIAVCHKNRAQTVVDRTWTLLAVDHPDALAETRADAFRFVCDRYGLDVPWRESESTDGAEATTDA